MELWGWCKLALDNVMKQELEQRSSSGHYKWGRQLPGEWENWWVQSVGESRRRISLRNTFQITYLWTDELGDHLSRHRSKQSAQTATEPQLIVRLFSVRTPALQLGCGGRKFRLWLEVTLFLFLVRINIYIHILIHLNHLARAWEKAATLGPGGAGAQRRFWCWKVCKLCPTVGREIEFWAPVSPLKRAVGAGCGEPRLPASLLGQHPPPQAQHLYCHGDRVLSASPGLGFLVVLQQWSHFPPKDPLKQVPLLSSLHRWINWWVREMKWLGHSYESKPMWPQDSDP